MACLPELKWWTLIYNEAAGRTKDYLMPGECANQHTISL